MDCGGSSLINRPSKNNQIHLFKENLLNVSINGRNRIAKILFLLLLCAALSVAACSFGGGDAGSADGENAAMESSGDSGDGESSPDATPVPEEESGDGEAASAPSSSGAGDNSTGGDGAGEEAASAPVAPPAEVSEGEASALAPADRNGMYSAPPEMTIDESKFYYATLKTVQGDITVQLFADRAPITVNNFVFLARDGYYNNTVFHRVLENFMAQAGDPVGQGSGGPGYEFEDEFFPGLSFDRPGLLAMANRGPRTNGSQFFLTFGPTPWLDGNHTIFGEVIEGIDVLNSITLRDPGNPGGFAGDEIYTILIEETDSSELPEPTPAPPTPTPTQTPTPYAPTGLGDGENPIADLEPSERTDIFNTAPEMVIDTSKSYSAVISTSKGDLNVELFADEAPVSVNNFVVLAELGFYDGLNVSLVNSEIALIGAPNPTDPTRDIGYLFEAEKGLTKPLIIGSMAYIPNREQPSLSSGSQILLAIIPPPRGVESQFSFFGQIVDADDILTSLTIEDTIDSITIESE